MDILTAQRKAIDDLRSKLYEANKQRRYGDVGMYARMILQQQRMCLVLEAMREVKQDE